MQVKIDLSQQFKLVDDLQAIVKDCIGFFQVKNVQLLGKLFSERALYIQKHKTDKG